jgi:hypothetical protein
MRRTSLLCDSPVRDRFRDSVRFTFVYLAGTNKHGKTRQVRSCLMEGYCVSFSSLNCILSVAASGFGRHRIGDSIFGATVSGNEACSRNPLNLTKNSGETSLLLSRSDCELLYNLSRILAGCYILRTGSRLMGRRHNGLNRVSPAQ